MFLIPRPQVLTGPPQGGVPELAPAWAGKVRKVIVNGVLPKGIVAGSTISKQTTKFGTSLVQTSRIWNGNVGSQYAINLGTRPNSATFLIIAERNCDCNAQQNIPLVMNCATLGDGGVSITMGNWWNSPANRNKVHAGSGDLWIGGVPQSSSLSDNELLADTPYTIVNSISTMTGGEYKLFAKDDSTGGYVSPVKLHLFVELDLQSPESAKSLSANPWQIFKRPDSRIFVPVSAGGTTTSLIVQDATHAHVADGVTLTTQWMLTVAEALHGHAADNITLGVTGTANLAIADATSGHTSDTVALTLNSLLAVFDAIHAHSADNLTLDTSNATALTVQDSTHAHGADNLGLSLDTWLAIVEAAHGHTADAPMLSLGQLSLQIADALHAMYSDIVFLTLPGGNLTTDQKFIIRATARRLAAIGLARNNIINRRAS